MNDRGDARYVVDIIGRRRIKSMINLLILLAAAILDGTQVASAIRDVQGWHFLFLAFGLLFVFLGRVVGIYCAALHALILAVVHLPAAVVAGVLLQLGLGALHHLDL